MTGARELDDGWPVVPLDGSYAAHWEHAVAITEEGPWVTTAEDGGYSQDAGQPGSCDGGGGPCEQSPRTPL